MRRFIRSLALSTLALGGLVGGLVAVDAGASVAVKVGKGAASVFGHAVGDEGACIAVAHQATRGNIRVILPLMNESHYAALAAASVRCAAAAKREIPAEATLLVKADRAA